MGDGVDWFNDMVAASKEAAGLPLDWGSTPTPLGAEDELEDAPRPSTLRAESTAELLPYGHVVRTLHGDEHLLERKTCSAVRAPSGAIVICDPLSLGWQGQPLAFKLAREELPVEVGFFRSENSRGATLQSVVAVIGDVDLVTSWSPLEDPDERLSIDVGCIAFAASGDLDIVARHAETRLVEVTEEVVVSIEADGAVVGALVAPGDGPWAYEMLTGTDVDGHLVAVLVDHHVMDRR